MFSKFKETNQIFNFSWILSMEILSSALFTTALAFSISVFYKILFSLILLKLNRVCSLYLHWDGKQRTAPKYLMHSDLLAAAYQTVQHFVVPHLNQQALFLFSKFSPPLIELIQHARQVWVSFSLQQPDPITNYI